MMEEQTKSEIKQRKLWMKWESLSMLREQDELNKMGLTADDKKLLDEMIEKAEAKYLKELFNSLPLAYQLDTNKDIKLGE